MQRLIWAKQVLFCLRVTVLPAYMVWKKLKQWSWLSFLVVSWDSHWTLKPTTSVLLSSVMIKSSKKATWLKEPIVLPRYPLAKPFSAVLLLRLVSLLTVKVPSIPTLSWIWNWLPLVLLPERVFMNPATPVRKPLTVWPLWVVVSVSWSLVTVRLVKQRLRLMPSSPRKKAASNVFMLPAVRKNQLLPRLWLPLRNTAPWNTPLLSLPRLPSPLPCSIWLLMLVVPWVSTSVTKVSIPWSYTMISQNRLRLTVRCLCCLDVLPDVKLSPEIFFTITPVCWKDLQNSVMTKVPVLWQPFPSLKPRKVTFPPSSPQTLFPSPTARFSWTKTCSLPVSVPPSMLDFPFQGLVVQLR